MSKKCANVTKFEIKFKFTIKLTKEMTKSVKSRQPNYAPIDTEPLLLFELNIFCSTSHVFCSTSQASQYQQQFECNRIINNNHNTFKITQKHTKNTD